MSPLHTQKYGNGPYQGWSYMGVSCKVHSETPAEAEVIVKSFTDELSELLKKYPEIESIESFSETMACFSQCLEIAARESIVSKEMGWKKDE